MTWTVFVAGELRTGITWEKRAMFQGKQLSENARAFCTLHHIDFGSVRETDGTLYLSPTDFCRAAGISPQQYSDEELTFIASLSSGIVIAEDTE